MPIPWTDGLCNLRDDAPEFAAAADSVKHLETAEKDMFFPFFLLPGRYLGIAEDKSRQVGVFAEFSTEDGF